MAAIEVDHLSYAYGRVDALHDVTVSVPEGALYALLGPNGSGKTTLLQILMGLRRARTGRVSLLGGDAQSLDRRVRERVSYIAEGQRLPGWMRLDQLEAYLAPLYASWDPALADELRDRFGLDPKRKVGTLSRGERMKAALLCALAPRPRVLLMDEPFTGMDAMVKDDIVRGMLATSGTEGWTVIIASHDISEVELLADWVGILRKGRLLLSEPIERLRTRFRKVDVIVGEGASMEQRPSDGWLDVERAGRRLSFVEPDAGAGYESVLLPARFPRAERIDVREATLREVFVAISRAPASSRLTEVAA